MLTLRTTHSRVTDARVLVVSKVEKGAAVISVQKDALVDHPFNNICSGETNQREMTSAVWTPGGQIFQMFSSLIIHKSNYPKVPEQSTNHKSFLQLMNMRVLRLSWCLIKHSQALSALDNWYFMIIKKEDLGLERGEKCDSTVCRYRKGITGQQLGDAQMNFSERKRRNGFSPTVAEMLV